MWHLWLQTSSKACGHATRGRQSVQAKLPGLRGHSTKHTLCAGGIYPAADGTGRGGLHSPQRAPSAPAARSRHLPPPSNASHLGLEVEVL